MFCAFEMDLRLSVYNLVNYLYTFSHSKQAIEPHKWIYYGNNAVHCENHFYVHSSVTSEIIF